MWHNFGAISSCIFGKLLNIKCLMLVEAAGVEPAIGTENTQVTDSENA
jgi:hypothetical protein